MAVTVTVPDEVARRLEAAAKACGVSVEQLAIELLSGVNRPGGDAAAELEAFIGSGTGDGSRFEIHDARRELARRRVAAGTRHL